MKSITRRNQRFETTSLEATRDKWMGEFVAKTAEWPIPAMSAFDPPASDEGRLDPLGMATFADRIADTYAAPVRARMRRVRFASVMCIASLVVPELDGLEPGTRGDSSDLAFERLTVEALARDSVASADIGIPGIAKAHSAVISGQRLSSGGYLKSPRVFGFHGVYRPFATSLALVDRNGDLLDAGRALVTATERDQGLDGLLDPRPGKPGRELLAWLIDETRKALKSGRNEFSPTNRINLPKLVAISRPAGMGKYERRVLRDIMNNPVATRNPADAEAFVEVLALLQENPPAPGTTEIEAIRQLDSHSSEHLHRRMAALQAYEEFARDLSWAFDGYRWLSATTLGGTPSPAQIASTDALEAPARWLSVEYSVACARLDELADVGADLTVGADFAAAFAEFASPMTPLELVEAVVGHHCGVQARKAPVGKRPWFDDVNGTWAARPLYALYDQPDYPSGFEHPYRIGALASFLDDLRG